MTSGPAEVVSGQASWVADEFGITLQSLGSPVGLSISELIEVGLRRNPRRAQLLVSTVLGKHLAADPRVIAGTGRLLGALVARKLSDDENPVPPTWITAAKATVSGVDPGALCEVLDSAPSVLQPGLLTFGFAETATSVGHLVADQLGSDYLHSTRRRDGDVPITAEFAEPHSHATGHLLRPRSANLLRDARTVVMVDDELSTGRTALNVIEALHVLTPRRRYVMAGLVDVRSPADDENRLAVAHRLGCRIDVVYLTKGEITVPAGTVDKVAAELADVEDISSPDARPGSQNDPAPTRIGSPWPANVPQGGRHGFVDSDRAGFDAAFDQVRAAVADACGSATRLLVIGTEELMYLPFRLALELARDPGREVMFQSTTRSPVHAIDRDGYPIRRRIDYRSAVLGSGVVSAGGEQALRHLYNCSWPNRAVGIGDTAATEPDLVVVVDDGHALPGPLGLAESITATTGTPVLLVVLTPGPSR